MKSILRIFSVNILLVTFIALPSWVMASNNFQVESKVIFNTACARCHEGECSGRMTFNLAKDAADKHIRRYGGEISPQTTRQLNELLRYMKEQCRFYPFTEALINDQKWGHNKLAKFRSVSHKAYFIPLGQLEPGSYRLKFTGFNGLTNSCIEIINNQFDFLDQQRISDDDQKRVLQFDLNESSECFLRITARVPMTLNQLELVRH